MKNLYLSLVLFPLVGISQTLINEVSRVSEFNDSGYRKTEKIETNFSIYVENDFIVFKNGDDVKKYEILAEYETEGEEDLGITGYDIKINKENYHVSVDIDYYNNKRNLFLISKDRDFTYMYYDKKAPF